MKSLIDFALNEEYERVKQLGDRLMEIESVIDWEAFRLLDIWIASRRSIADTYNTLLPREIVKPYVAPTAKHVYHLYVIRTENRDKMQ